MLFYFQRYLLFLLVCGLVAGIFTPVVASSSEAANGVIFLTQDQVQENIIDLKGEWEFYWQAFHDPQAFHTSNPPQPSGFISVPETWNGFKIEGVGLPGQGYATYRLHVSLEDTVSSLAIRMKTVSTAAILFVNGKKVYQVGQPSAKASEARPDYRLQIIRLPEDTYTHLELVLHVSNYHYRKGGLWNPIFLGKEDVLRQKREHLIYYDYFLLGSILLMGLYHLVLFLLRRQDLSLLYFGLFCFCISLRVLTTNEYAILTLYPSLNWVIIVRIEYLSFIWGIPAFTAFVGQIFKEEFSSVVLKISLTAAFIGTTITFMMPPQVFTLIPVPYEILIVGLSLYGYFVAYKAWRKGKGESVIFLLGFTVFFITIINDILHSNEIVQTANYFPEGLLIFIFAQSFLLAVRFSRLFRKAKSLSHKLNVANNTLEKRVSERTQSLQAANEDLLQKNQQIAEQNDILTKLNSELDHFVYSVSHDLRAPITSALGLIEVARYEQDPLQVINYLDLQEHSLLKLDQFIQSILDYSRNARTALQLKEVSLRQLIKQSIETYAYLPDFERIHWDIDVDNSQAFISDERRINIIINNIISNAIRYADFRKATSTILIRVRSRKEGMSFIIKDNGIGIGAGHLPKIFDMFYRANAYAKGSGLGLFIVKETVEKLGGCIRVFSREREGTMFVILLPLLHVDTCPVAVALPV